MSRLGAVPRAAAPQPRFAHSIGALVGGSDLHSGSYTLAEAKARCAAIGAVGFTAFAREASPAGKVDCFFKSSAAGNANPQWQTYLLVAPQPAAPSGGAGAGVLQEAAANPFAWSSVAAGLPAAQQRHWQPGLEPEPEPEPACAPDAAEYVRFGISVDGLLYAAGFAAGFSGVDDLEMTTSDMCHAHIRPATVPAGWVDEATLTDPKNKWYEHSYVHTASGSRQASPPKGTRSFCELLQADPATAHFVGKPTHFLSHAWLYSFANLVDALAGFVAAQPAGSPAVYFWYDCFCIDEHAAQDVPQEWWGTTFKEAIRLMGHTVMMLSPWDNPVPLTRAWCLWELFCTIETGSNFDVCLGPAEQELFESDLTAASKNLTSSKMFKTFTEAIERIDVSKSEAGKESDLAMIIAAVEATGSCHELNQIAKAHLERWIFEEVANVLYGKAAAGEMKEFMRVGVAGAAGMAGLVALEEAKAAQREAIQMGSALADDAVDAVATAAVGAVGRSFNRLLSR